MCGLAKNGSFGFAEGSALCVGTKQNVPLVRLAKIVFKKVRWGKNKKHWVGLSGGLLVDCLKYGLYDGHLSKWFVSLCLCLNFGRSVVFGTVILPLAITSEQTKAN